MYRLHGVYESQILIYKIDQSATMIGRDPKSKVCIKHPAVSKHHALLELIDGSLFVTDLNSDNGTFVNDEAVESKERFLLQPGDDIRIGDRQFTLYSEEPAVTDDTAALTEDARHPLGPIKAFPPDEIPARPVTETVKVDADSLKEEAARKEDGQARGPSLTVREGKKYSLPVMISHPEFLIGRGKGSHMRLMDKSASKIHSRLVRRKGRYYLYDDNSLNGTYVNGIKIRGVSLCDGDLILIGNTVIRFNDPDSPKTKADPKEVEKDMAEILHRDYPGAAGGLSGKTIGIIAGGTAVFAGIAFLVLRLAGIV
jgi:pSer/pThr/pTyr-binding forkhead associated (FHA) protein